MFIIVLNIFLTKITVKLVEQIGYDTHSKVYSKISDYIFFATFFNTALVIQLANAYFGEYFRFTKRFFNGQYNDYSYDWYKNVGNQIVISMIINAVCPILEYNIENLLHWYEVRSDQSWCKDKDETIYKTKCTQVM